MSVYSYMKLNATMESVVLAFLFGVTLFVGLGQGVFVHAQTLTTTATVQPMCASLQSNLRYGSNDYVTSGAVSSLQNFLANQGYFNSAYIGSGRFGAMTLRSVMQFQSAHGIPATGYVGVLTRAAIAQIGCGTSTVPPTVTAANLYTLNPSSGPVGSTVSITGFGFTNDNTVLMDGSVAAANVPITSSIAISCTTNPACHGGINQTISFTVPSSLAPYCAPNMACAMYQRLVTPGVYSITVKNSNGTSNTLQFTVTGATSVQPLSITGLDAPASLSLGQQGTWVVHALSNGSGTLHYSAVWGDEAAVGNNIMAPQNTSIQSSASFTHAYSHSGTYTAQFTVTDDYGHSVSTNNTVVVTPLY